MPDWADKEAASAIYDSSDWELSMDARVVRALRKAKADGMREAAELGLRHGLTKLGAERMQRRAEKIERGEDA